MKAHVVTLAAAFAVFIAGCSGGPSNAGDTSVVALRITPSNPVVRVGDDVAFVATAFQVNGQTRVVNEDPSLDWESSAPSIVAIDDTGTGVAQAPGEAMINARLDGLASPPQKVIVNVAPTPTPTPTPAPTADHVVISELLYNPSVDPAGELIEIHNPTASPVTLDGWRLAYDGGGTTYFTFPGGTTIAAGAYAVVCNTPTTCGIAGAFDSSSNTAFPDTTGEWIVLFDGASATIDEMAYGTGNTGTKPASWCAGNDPQANATVGNSVQRKPTGSDGDTCDDWISNTAPTPGGPTL